MLNSEIKYKLSKDYKELYRLLSEGNILIGFIQINNDSDNAISRLVQIGYNKEYKALDLGFFYYFTDLNEKELEKVCLANNIRFIPYET